MTPFFSYLSSLAPEEGVLITSSVNRRYLTGFASSEGIVFAAKGQAILFLDMRYYEMAVIAQKEGRIPQEFTLDHYKNYVRVIEDFLRQGVKILRFEDRRTVCSRLDELKNLFPAAEFLPLGDAVERMRRIKTPEEVRRIQKAQELTTAHIVKAKRHMIEGDD